MDGNHLESFRSRVRAWLEQHAEQQGWTEPAATR